MEKKICWANTDNFEKSDLVILGIPDESQSHSLRKGTSEAPYFVRELSNMRDSYTREGNRTLGLPVSGLGSKNVFDQGNIKREKITEFFDKIISNSKIPLTIGGDHSITTQIIKTIAKKYKPISLVYFDAHPDFITTTANYYGSVISDVLPYIDTKSSIQIGIRTPEKEELENLKKHGIKIITPFDVKEKGIREISKIIGDHISENVYVSFDMDCIDPSFAPGVSVPVPMGLSNVEGVYLLKSIIKRGVIGFDLMEICPSYDIKDRTSHLGSRIIAEVISSIP